MRTANQNPPSLHRCVNVSREGNLKQADSRKAEGGPETSESGPDLELSSEAEDKWIKKQKQTNVQIEPVYKIY